MPSRDVDETPLETAGTYSDPATDVAAVSARTDEQPETGGAFDAGLAARYSVANLGASVVYGLFNTAMPLYLSTYRLPEALVGLLANERSFVGAFVQPVVGRISDRIHTRIGRRKPFFLVGVPLMAISLFTLSTHPDFWIMLGLMTVGSFFLAVAVDPYLALLADLFPLQQRGRVGGFLGVTTALGIIVFALLALFLWQDHEPWVFGLTIAILCVTFAFTFFTVKEPATIEKVEREPRAKGSFMTYVRGLLKYPEAAKYTGALVLYWLGAGGATPFVTLFTKKALGADEGQAFIPPIAFVVSTALLSVPAGLLADRIGKKKVLTIGLIIYGLGAIIGSQATDLTQATIALGVIGIGNAGTTAPLNPLLVDLIPKTRTAELLGLGSAIWSFAQPLGSVLAGLMVELARIFVVGTGPSAPQSGVGAGLLQLAQVADRIDKDSIRAAFVYAGVLVVLSAVVLQSVRPERARTGE